MAPSGHETEHAKQWMHLDSMCWICLAMLHVSGLWHHLHLRLQPFMNIVDLIPGPSWIDILWIVVIVPLIYMCMHLVVTITKLGYIFYRKTMIYFQKMYICYVIPIF